MKTSAAVVALACLLASTSAFTAPSMATRAVGAKKPVAVKAPVAKKPVAKKIVAKVVAKPVAAKKPVVKAVKKVVAKAPTPKGPPASQGYPSFRNQSEKWRPFKASGGGNKAPPATFSVPDFSDPKLQKARDPAFYAAAAKTRLSKKTGEFVFDDGLTELERKQRKTIPTFLTGSAKSQADKSAIRGDIATEEFAFGLNADRFQLLFITVFGLFTLVGSLSGNLKL